jgi:hypothetical protein
MVIGRIFGGDPCLLWRNWNESNKQFFPPVVDDPPAVLANQLDRIEALLQILVNSKGVLNPPKED